jgi:hypothetical protein
MNYSQESIVERPRESEGAKVINLRRKRDSSSSSLEKAFLYSQTTDYRFYRGFKNAFRMEERIDRQKVFHRPTYSTVLV